MSFFGEALCVATTSLKATTMGRIDKRLLFIACAVIASGLAFTAFKLVSAYKEKTASPELKRTLVAAMQTSSSDERRQYLHDARLQARTSADVVVLQDFDEMLKVDDYFTGLAMTDDLPDHESSVMQEREDRSKEAQLSAMRFAYVSQNLPIPEELEAEIQKHDGDTAAHRAKAAQDWAEHCNRLLTFDDRSKELHRRVCQELGLPPDPPSKTRDLPCPA